MTVGDVYSISPTVIDRRYSGNNATQLLPAGTPIQHDPQWRVACIPQEAVYQKTLPIGRRNVIGPEKGTKRELGDKQRNWRTDDHYANADLTRSGVNGTSRSRTPVALKMALLTA